MPTTPPRRDAIGIEDYLDVEGLDRDLRQRSVSGAAVTLLAQAVKLGLHFVGVYVLARILAPADFGLLAMATAMVGLVHLFRDFGLSTATIQQDAVSHAQVSTLFWINALLGLGLAATAAAAAPLIAWFYDEPRLTAICVALAAGLFCGALCQQHGAILRRRMRFHALARIEIVAQATATAAALAAAALGAGYWALVVQQVLLPATSMVGVWTVCGWRPGWPTRGAGVRPMLRFGGHLTGFGLANYVARNADDMLIGRVWGAGPLGLYNRAYALLLLPLRQINGPVSGVTLPALSRLKDQPERYRNYYLRVVNAIAWLSMPLVAMLFAVSDAVVLFVLGEAWGDAAGLFRVLALAAFVQPALATGGWVYITMGQTHRMSRWGGLWALLYTASFVAGLPWGPRGVALAYTVTVYVLIWPSLWAAYRFSPVTPGAALGAMARPALVGLVVVAAGSAARIALGGATPGIVLLAATAAASAAAGLIVATVPPLRADVRRIWSLRSELRRS